MTALIGIRERLDNARLCLLTDLRRDEDDFAQFITEVCAGGVDVIQIRDPRATSAQIAAACSLAMRVARPFQTLIIAGHDCKAAVTSAADGLHLPSIDPAGLAAARSQLSPYALVGASVHSRNEFRTALASRLTPAGECADSAAGALADYLFVSPVFLDHLEMLGLVSYVAEHMAEQCATTPWFAVGGITLDNVDRVLDAGARRIGVSTAIGMASRPGEAAALLKDRIVRGHWAVTSCGDEAVAQ